MDRQREQNEAHGQNFSPPPHLALPERLVLGVAGSIAAYKAPLILRELVSRGTQARVVLSPAAKRFVSPLVLHNLSGHPVAWRMFDSNLQKDGSWHIAWARWCQAMLIAPCSATTLSRLATGQADTALALVALALPTSTPLYLAPAMDTEMWLHPATQRNVEILRRDGVTIIEPDTGELASGLIGPGRLPEPLALLRNLRSPGSMGPLRGTTVLITAGPTRERLDDIRFLSNHSSGKMGYALAVEAARRGARVILVSGPVALSPPSGVEHHRVESAQQMFDAVMAHCQETRLFIMAAAVADFRPAEAVAGKLKKELLGAQPSISLERTPDILAAVGRGKLPHQVVVGFALEAADHLENARAKLSGKNCDLMVLNAANRPDSGFGGERNTITLLGRDGSVESFPPMAKAECAAVILEKAQEALTPGP